MRLATTLVAVLLAISVGHVTGLTRPVESGVRWVTQPVLGVVAAAAHGVRSTGDYFRTRESLRRDNERLRQQLAELVAENASLTALEADLRDAQPLLEFLQASQDQGVIARVIAESADPSSRQVTVSRGSSDGLRVGAAAMTNRGILVGKVTRVEATSADVRLLTDPGSSVAVTIEHGDGVPGLAVGEHGLALRLTLVPSNTPIANGDRIVTSGIEPSIPRGLLIGTVQDITQPPGELFQQATIVPAMSYDQLTVIGFLNV